MVHGEALAALAAAALVPSIALLAALVFFGLGSVYAIKKSVFLLGTLNLVILSCLGVEWPPVSRIAERVFSPRATSFAASAAGPLLVIAALAFVYLGRPSIPVDVTARYDRQLQSVMREPDATVLEGVSVSMNSAYDRNVNFTVAVARLQPGPRAYWAQVALFRRQPLGLQPLSNAGAQYALVGAAEAVRYTDACRFRQYVEVVVLHFACAYDAAAH